MTRTHQALGWFGLVAFVAFVVAVVMFAFLDGPVTYLLDIAAWSAPDGRTGTTADRIQTVWDYWPLFGIGLPLVLFLYRRAGTESSPR